MSRSTQEPLCAAASTTIFFNDYSYQKYVWFDLLAVKHVKLILWLKVYVAFNELYNLKILLCEWKIGFKIDSLMYEKYIKKKPTQYQPPPLSRGTTFSTKFWKGGIGKKDCKIIREGSISNVDLDLLILMFNFVTFWFQ